jgi:hypothetical protein
MLSPSCAADLRLLDLYSIWLPALLGTELDVICLQGLAEYCGKDQPSSRPETFSALGLEVKTLAMALKQSWRCIIMRSAPKKVD